MSAVPANPTGAADPTDEAEPLTTGQDDGAEPEVTEPVEESEEVGTRVVAGNEEGKRHVPEANPPPTTGYSPPFWM